MKNPPFRPWKSKAPPPDSPRHRLHAPCSQPVRRFGLKILGKPSFVYGDMRTESSEWDNIGYTDIPWYSYVLRNQCENWWHRDIQPGKMGFWDGLATMMGLDMFGPSTEKGDMNHQQWSLLVQAENNRESVLVANHESLGSACATCSETRLVNDLEPPVMVSRTNAC